MPNPEQKTRMERREDHSSLPPLPSYSLAERCPACDAPLFRQHCKARCENCGFFWDCSEL